MKSKSEIRWHLRDLQIARVRPCACRGTPHEAQCVIGGKMMEAAAGVLAWVLGENEPYQSVVDRLRQAAGEERRGGGS